MTNHNQLDGFKRLQYIIHELFQDDNQLNVVRIERIEQRILLWESQSHHVWMLFENSGQTQASVKADFVWNWHKSLAMPWALSSVTEVIFRNSSV